VRRIGRRLIVTATSVLAGTVFVGVVATEAAMHVLRRPMARPELASAVANETGATWESVQVTAPDGIALRAWLFTPVNPGASAVLVMHGINDARVSMLGHARFLLRNGFTVLMPDTRGHGESGGAIITYGIDEAGDVSRWVDWLLATRHPERVYGLGMSLGGAILLQSLAHERRFDAVVADSPFSSFREVAYDRLQELTRIEHHLFWPVVESGLVYARIRYHRDLRLASPAAALRSCHTPVLLIHGGRDEKTPIRHSRELHAIDPVMTRLWEVPGVRHTRALATLPDVYARTVVDWFHSHGK